MVCFPTFKFKFGRILGIRTAKCNSRAMDSVVNTCSTKERLRIELGNGSEVEYFPHFFQHSQAYEWMNYLDRHIEWIRPSLHIFGRTCSQPRETCYVAKDGLPPYKYSGYEPVVHSWEEYTPLTDILNAVHEALPGTTFNTLLLNRYKHGGDYVGWHSDNEILYGPTPTIASVTFGTEREFLLRRKRTAKASRGDDVNALKSKVHTTENDEAVEPPMTPLNLKRAYNSDLPVPANIFEKLKAKQKDDQSKDHHSFMLKHGSLFIMKGYTQRDCEHSVPKRMKVPGLRINLTFRYVLEN